MIAPRPVASASSFELVPLDDGAALVWGAPSVPAAGVLAVAVGPRGEPRGIDQRLSDRLAIEVTAVTEGARIAAVWVAQGDSRSTALVAEAAFAPGGISSFAPAIDLGAAVPLITPGRGRLAIATGDDGAFLVHHRMPPERCTAGAPGAECARIGRRRVDSPGAGRPARGDGGLEVPEPCDPFVVASVSSRGTWYAALCHVEAGGPATTVYALRSSISLAAANEILPGCTPRALVPTAEGAALVADCPDGLAVAWQDEMGQPLGAARPATISATCVDGRPVLSAAGPAYSLAVPLTAPVGRIEAMLPTEIGGANARAAWTGTSVLVARHRPLGDGAGEVVLTRWECHDGALERTDR